MAVQTDSERINTPFISKGVVRFKEILIEYAVCR